MGIQLVIICNLTTRWLSVLLTKSLSNTFYINFLVFHNTGNSYFDTVLWQILMFDIHNENVYNIDR